MKNRWIAVVALSAVLLATSCTRSIIQHSQSIHINPAAKIAVVPFSNNTETPLAGERAMSITASALQSFGMHNIKVYQNRMQGKILFPGMNRVVSQKALLEWAKSEHAQLVLTGNVNEWSYKVGLDGEPVVGLEMQLIDLRNNRIVWTAVGSKSGGSRVAVSTVAQEVIDAMIKGL